MIDVSPMSRVEKQLRKILGQSIETEPPKSRIEILLQEIIDGGGIGGGSYKIKDQYATLAELEAAHPTGADGDAYLVGDPTHIYVWLDDRQEYADGGLFAAVPGLDGVGIASIEKTSTSGLVDTYTITYTDGNTDTFTVTNGEEGVGITNIEKTATAGNVDTYTITLSNGNTYNFTVTNGGGVPSGGTTGQILAKKSDADGDVEWIPNEGGSDVSSELASLSAAASELASETGSLSAENSTQTSEINSLSSEYNSLSSEISSNTSDISSLSQSMSELASAAASQSTSQSQIDSTQDVALASLSTENSTHTSEIGSMASEIDSMSVSDVSSELESLSTENSQQTSEINSLASEIDSMSTSDYSSEIASLASETSTLASETGSLSTENSTQTSEISSLSQSMSELASAASSTSTAQSEYDSTQDVSLASLSTENSTHTSELSSLSTENSTQTSEIDSLSTAASELGSELEVIGSEVAEKQDELVEGPGIDIDSTTHEIKTERVVFEGTLQVWEALTTEEKKGYTDAIITNDEQTGAVDQVPTEGSNNLVTSGGVYTALDEKVDTFSGTVEDESSNTYTAVTCDGVAFDETNNQLLLKVDGADTVIPFKKAVAIDLTGYNTYDNVQQITGLTIGKTYLLCIGGIYQERIVNLNGATVITAMRSGLSVSRSTENAVGLVYLFKATATTVSGFASIGYGCGVAYKQID